MITLSHSQIRTLEGARFGASARTILLELEQAARDAGTAPSASALGEQATRIADFCAQFLVITTGNVRKVARVHARAGIGPPDPRNAAPLRRQGFSETERVEAYVQALETGKTRLILNRSI